MSANPFNNQVMRYKPTIKNKVPLEEDEAVLVSNWLKLKKIPHTHIPLEGKMKVQYMKKLAAMGCSKGFPDYIIFTPTKQLFVELKRRRKIKLNGQLGASPSTVSDEQKEWIETINCYSYADARVCYGFNEVQEFIKEYIKC